MSNDDRYSPSLQGDLRAWKDLVDVARDKGPEEILKRAIRTFQSKEEFEVKEKGLDYVISSESERVKTLEDLLKETNVNLEEFSIERYITNKWDQNSVQAGLVELYQVKAWLKRKYLEQPDPAWLQNWAEKYSTDLPSMTYSSEPSDKKPIILALADLHTGGFSEGDELIPDYNVDEVRERLEYIASVVNATGRPVYVKLLGDLIESFTGLNHKDTWKQIEKHGMEVALIAFDLVKEFIMKLWHFKEMIIIGGNHDRISSAYGADKQGQVAYLVAEMLKRNIEGINVEFNPILHSSTHDNIAYIVSHGDKKVSKSDANELILSHGEQDLYNVMLYAHGHEEKVVKNTRKLRVHQIPPVCTPNQYAIENGYNGASGFVLIESNKFGRVDITTKGL